VLRVGAIVLDAKRSPDRRADPHCVGSGQGYLEEIAATAAAPVIEKYTGVIAAADVFTESTTLTFQVMPAIGE
jgi:hypothetical protein